MGFVPKLLLCLFALMVTACSQLPRGAALQREIIATKTDAQPDIAVYPITRSFLPTLATWPSNGTTAHKWLKASPGSDAQIIRRGDMWNLTIWDSGENSLLTGTDQRATGLTGLRVSAASTIFVPMSASSRCPAARQITPARSCSVSLNKAPHRCKSSS
jgi:polysaccharide export outer membrane protein